MPSSPLSGTRASLALAAASGITPTASTVPGAPAATFSRLATAAPARFAPASLYSHRLHSPAAGSASPFFTSMSSSPSTRAVMVASHLSAASIHASSSSSATASGAATPASPPQPPQPPVLARRVQNLRVFILNRPSALNALSTEMVQLMTPQLKAWNESDLCKVILLMAASGSRAFCAGGDVKDIVLKAKTRRAEEVAAGLKFFEQEYQLNHLIGTLKKPFISLMDGITMGGGVGLSVHAPFRVVTENTVFAMPESGIGLFPDVGGSFFLPRLDGELGTYLGLTGHRLKASEVLFAGIGTHYIPAHRIPMLITRLSEVEADDPEAINAILEEYVGDIGPEEWQTWSLGGKVADAINRCFKFDRLEEIVEALKKEASKLQSIHAYVI
ncbi:hypothetical protein HK405_004261 [Cladochytrium tenue]|nr:hypothetical protein HK405_004261 [Cladochytrium tenue]